MGTKSFNNYADLITFSRASSATYLDSDGVLKTATTNTPRIEYDADGNRLGLLIEEQRTNLVTYSNDFTNASWTKLTSTVTANQTVSPDGSENASLLAADGLSGSELNVYDTVFLNSGTTYTFSVYLKATPSESVTQLYIFQSGFKARATFDLANGTATDVEGTGAAIVSVGNGWYRCSIKHTATATTHTVGVYKASLDAEVYAYGAQLEAGSFPTSYIPTSGSTATRARDSVAVFTPDFGLNTKAGTFFAEFDYLDPSNVNNNYVAGGGSSARIMYNNAGNNLWQTFDGTAAVTFQGIDGDGDQNKLALAVKTGKDIATAKNGLITGSSTTATNLMLQLNSDGYFNIGGSSANQLLNGHIKSLKYYPRRLSNDQLQELTQ